jgi:hypothetical protein
VLTLAAQTLEHKVADFDPKAFRDRYEEALLAHLKARQAGTVQELDKGDVICSTAPPLLRHAYGMWHLPCAKNIDEDAFNCVLSTLPRAAAEFWRV